MVCYHILTVLGANITISEFGWVYKYSEKKADSAGDPWRIRHTAIYHIVDRKRARSVLFVIHPSPSAHFKVHLQQVLQQPKARLAVSSNPMLIHSMLISSHLSSWRDFLEHQETHLWQLVSVLICDDKLSDIY
jgi:hypothetical protein